MYGHCPICGERHGTMDGRNFTYCEHIKREATMQKIKWSREGEKGTFYRRKYPDSSYHRIVTKKAKFLGKLMHAVLVAGGAPGHFRPNQLRCRTMEDVLDSLLPNNVNFEVSYDFSKCTHYKTKGETLPDGEDIEICLRCGKSRSVWEQGESEWMEVDIEQLKKDIRRRQIECQMITKT